MKDIQFTQDYYVYTPKKQGVYPIQESDWNRIKEFIKKIIPEKKIYNILSSLAFGIFISSVFSLISLYTLSNLPSWIIPTNWAISIASLILGISLIIIDNQQKQIIKISSQFIIDEMEKLERQFNKNDFQKKV